MKTIVIKLSAGRLTLGNPAMRPGWQSKSRPGGRTDVAYYHVVDVPDDVPTAAVLTKINSTTFNPMTPPSDAAPEDFVLSWDRLDAPPGTIVGTQPRKDASRMDVIQERCIDRMRELTLLPRNVWERLGDSDEARNALCGYNHINEYLSRRSSMSSHKLQHVLRALDLSVTAH